ncbi:hypothetical protein L21_0896 [Methanoculleus chikugoensis]|uniref:Uncharacterized protein n=1 Tax=Methanoculleus chikugoensis TaxID=118126 RepID=A0A1M4MJL5_9EURY|nr:hypothetical protein [Methanoculleus chikugoensis]MDD3516477.1 hypothetical protein [Synergistaceae bacterium]SCL75008.1 hypothetical protein L21_0896 [Methanoculleus chikugoensis]
MLSTGRTKILPSAGLAGTAVRPADTDDPVDIGIPDDHLDLHLRDEFRVIPGLKAGVFSLRPFNPAR